MIGSDASCEVVRNTMTQWALDTTCCSTIREARTLLSGNGFSLIFCEDHLSDGSYHEVLNSFAKPSKSRFIVMSSTPELDDKYDEAMRLGAFEMIATPCRKSDVQWIVIRAMQEESRRGGSRRRPATEETGEEPATVGTNGSSPDTPEGGQ